MIGLYGKIPAHGDFVSREIDNHFVSLWDAWLQQVISESRSILGERWLDIYLVSPMWRFFLSKGIIDEQCWSGVILPSVDSVGRYFPLTAAFPIGIDTNSSQFLAENDKNYSELEAKCRESLESGSNIDCLSSNLSSIRFGRNTEEALQSITQSGQILLNDGVDKRAILSIDAPFYTLMEKLLSAHCSNYALWSSSGVENKSMIVSSGLPHGSEFIEMLTGTN